MDRISKLRGTSFDVPPNVPAEWAKALEEYLQPFEKAAGLRSDFGRDLVGFVLYGEPTAALHEAANVPASVIRALPFPKQVSHSKIYEYFDRIPVAVARRWVQVLEAFDHLYTPQYRMFFPNGIHWPEIVLMHGMQGGLGIWSTGDKLPAGLSVQVMEGLFVHDGLAASDFVVAALASPVTSSRYGAGPLEGVPAMAGVGEAIERHADAVRPLLTPAAAGQREHVLRMLARVSDRTLKTFAAELAELATSSSKQVRATAEPLVRRIAHDVVAPSKQIALQAKPAQRVNALKLLWTIAQTIEDEELGNFARETASLDKAPSVQALVAEWQGLFAALATPVRYKYELPTVIWSNGMTLEIECALEQFFSGLDRAVELTNKEGRNLDAEERAAPSTHRRHREWKDVQALASADRRRLRDYLASPDPVLQGKRVRMHFHWNFSLLPLLQQFASAPGVTPQAAVKVLNFFEDARGEGSSDQRRTVISAVMDQMHRVKGQPTLLELQLLLEPVSVSAGALFRMYCNNWGSIAREWPDTAVWPFFAHNLDILLKALLEINHGDYQFNRAMVFKAISTLPAPPEAVVNALFDLSLGSAKTERLRAQEALANQADKEARIVVALSDSKAETRTVAAQWLARLKHERAIPALEAAVRKEKNDVAKGALLDALEAFGRPVGTYLDRDQIAADALKTLAKGVPKELEWFPATALPTVRWSENGKEVGNDVLRGLLIQACKQKSTEPNAVLRKTCGMFNARDREAFGQFVLEAWLREDVKPISGEEALQRAQAQAQQTHSYHQNYPAYARNDPDYGKSIAELTATFLPGLQRQPAGSCVGAKGILAIAAACCAERAAAPVARYLKEYYGTRAAQGKALIAMLAWIEHPSATQLMLSVGTRFRTRGFQEEATRQAEALAERKGWTLGELADRAIPSAGFDENNELSMSYGQRTFTARLLPDFRIELFNPEGKRIASLPEPRQGDDPDLAKDARKAFASAKKEIKSIVDLQTDRLYEALCTEREWSFEDWSLYLNRHPIVRRMLPLLVWAVVEDGKVTGTFRPLDDGTLTDFEDNEVTIEPAARVRLAHHSSVSDEVASSWQKHLVDYEIAPLFQQFGKGGFALPTEKERETEVLDFQGHMIEAFALRGRARKLGYTRGQAEDGGWFRVYEKRFPTLGMSAVIEFTGNPLPEENRNVALLGLSFLLKDHQKPVELARVPKVLLSECYHDIRLIAADGSGFDPQWEKKSEY